MGIKECVNVFSVKIKKTNILFAFFLGTFILGLETNVLAQESTDIHKTRSSAIIGGVKYYLHTVEKGQTLFAIAKFYGKDVNDIVIENPDAIDGIKPGQILRIPVEKKKPGEISVTDTSNFIIHKVEKGQTLYSITKQYGISDEKLKAINPELKDGLKLGQELKIPSLKPKPEVVKTPVVLPTNVVTTSTISKEAMDHKDVVPANYTGEKKDEYNIAFFLPFHAEEANAMDLDKIIKGDAEFPNKTNVALQFYEGVLLAIDSLKKLKFNAKIFVYDIDDRDSANIVNILQKPELKEMDLMIGPLYGSSFMPVAKFAKENNIPIVSPFTQINKILFNNPYVCKLSPSGTLQVEQMAHFVVDTFSTDNVILVNNLNVKELPLLNAFKTTANADLLKKGFSAADSLKVVAGLTGVQSSLSSTKLNVIVLPSNNQSYVTDFISQLNIMADKNKIVLFGLQSWVNYDNLDFEYLNNLSLHIPANSYVDYTDPATISFIKKYRDKFQTEPEMFAYQGFDAVMYFLSSLQKYGTGFLKDLPQNEFIGIETKYSFSQYPSDSGFENKFVFILKYKDYQLVKAN